MNSEAGSIKILTIANDRRLLELASETLTNSGYLVLSAINARVALEAWRLYAPHLIMLDLLMEGEPTGVEIFRQLQPKAAASRIPILPLANRKSETVILPPRKLARDRILTAPFSPKALLARVAEALRRARISRPESKGLTLAGLTLDVERRDVRAGDAVINLTEMEYHFLRTLIQADGRVLTRAALIAAARGLTPAIVGRSVDNHVAAIRRKLGSLSVLLETVRGYGYRLRQDKAAPGK